jgi:uncharacterized tellurite resistance protein B-like protein
MGHAKHPAIKLPVEERVDYLVVIASMAGADGVVKGEELANLSELCKALDLGAAETGQVLAAAEHVDGDRIRSATHRLRTSELRFTLMTDLLFLAYADGDFDGAEQKEVSGVAVTLGVDAKQLEALKKYVLAVLKAKDAKGLNARDLKALGGDVGVSSRSTSDTVRRFKRPLTWHCSPGRACPTSPGLANTPCSSRKPYSDRPA